MLIGIPKEIAAGERRVAAAPENVAKFIKLGFDVAVEAGAEGLELLVLRFPRVGGEG